MSDIELLQNHVPTLQEIERLQHEMIKMPQAELETEHYFSGGMYCRKLIRPAGTLIVGKVHKKDHFFMAPKVRLLLGLKKAWSL
jgi:hypothetical protein